MTDAEATPPIADTFARAVVRHRFTAREATVVAVGKATRQYLRVTLSGPDFADFHSTGPADHMRVFFPDPDSGRLVAPRAAGPGQDGVIRPSEGGFGRDFTPLYVREDGGRRLVDIDILRHPAPGPAAHWAAHARVGDTLVLVGPRASKAVPARAPRVIVIVDGTALPSAGRWLTELPATTRVDIVAGGIGLRTARKYLSAVSAQATAHGTARAFGLSSGDKDLVGALTALGPDASTYVFAAGEASALVQLRRHLRHTLHMPREQYSVTGYWRRGVDAWDHHAPIDPADMD